MNKGKTNQMESLSSSKESFIKKIEIMRIYTREEKENWDCWAVPSCIQQPSPVFGSPM